MIGVIIVVVLAVSAIATIIVGLFNDKANAIMITIISIGVLIVCGVMHANGTFAEKLSQLSAVKLAEGLEEGKTLEETVKLHLRYK